MRRVGVVAVSAVQKTLLILRIRLGRSPHLVQHARMPHHFTSGALV